MNHMKTIQRSVLMLCLGLTGILSAQNYFPGRGDWEQKDVKEAGMKPAALEEAVSFATANEYSGSRDLRIAILKGFEREPFHEILGPTKKRGGPAGMILKNGYLVKQWGDTERVDMTFSVTKSFLSTVAARYGLIRRCYFEFISFAMKRKS